MVHDPASTWSGLQVVKTDLTRGVFHSLATRRRRSYWEGVTTTPVREFSLPDAGIKTRVISGCKSTISCPRKGAKEDERECFMTEQQSPMLTRAALDSVASNVNIRMRSQGLCVKLVKRASPLVEMLTEMAKETYRSQSNTPTHIHTTAPPLPVSRADNSTMHVEVDSMRANTIRLVSADTGTDSKDTYVPPHASHRGRSPCTPRAS